MNDQIALSIRRYIGNRIKYARLLNDHESAVSLAERLRTYAPYLGWTRDILTNAENGRREINLEELCAIATVQDRSVGWYFADAPDSLREHIPGYLSPLTYPRDQLVADLPAAPTPRRAVGIPSPAVAM